MKKLLVLIALAFVIGGCDGKSHEDHFIAREVTVGVNTYKYRVYIPENRQPGEKLPVMLYLHGSGARGEQNEAQITGFNNYINEDPARFSFIIVAPQCRPGTNWSGEMIEQAVAALDQAVAEFNGDDSRLYLAGYSMGGSGAWHVGVLYPDKFAALIPIAGSVKPTLSARDEPPPTAAKISALTDSADPFAAFAEELKQKPVWVFHGGKDDAVEESRKIVEALKNAGNTGINYTEFENMGHNVVEAAFDEPKLFEWLGKQQRK